MNDLLSELQSQLGPGEMERLSQALGADEPAVERATSATVPLLLQALSRNASTDEGAQSLYTALEEDHDGSILGNLDGLMANPQAFDGAAILGHVFGNRQQPVEQDLSRGTGLNPQAMGMLLQILAPIVMGMIGKKVQGKALNPADLSGLLGGQAEQAEQVQPGLLGNLSKILDQNADGSVMDDLQRLAGGLFGKR